MKFFLMALFIFAQSFASELEILPINENGRFIPWGKPTFPPQETKMIPSKKDPSRWLDLSSLKEDRNPSLFSDQDWIKLKEAFNTPLFAKTYWDAYLPLTQKPFFLSKTTKLYFPTLMQLQIEVWYTKWPLVNLAIFAYLAALALFLLSDVFPKLKASAWITFSIAFLLHTLLLTLRSFILMRPPVSSMGETIIYVPWIAVLISFFLSKSLQTTLPVIAAAGISACLLAILQWTFTAYPLENVQAVLNSQLWLTIHVLMIVASYGALILAGVLGHIYLMAGLMGKKTSQPLLDALLKSLYVGVALLIPGTILGGVWAAQSWGRFWDWDPKESWAFISSCTYLLIIHAHRFGKIASKGLAIGSIIGLIAISFTWYGVNYILGTGLHSYGFGSGGEWIYFTYLLLECAFITLCLIRREKTFKPLKENSSSST